LAPREDECGNPRFSLRDIAPYDEGVEMKFSFSRTGRWIATLLVCSGVYALALSMDFPKARLQKASEYQLTPQFFKFISVGFWPAAHDYLWIRTLQLIGSGETGGDVLRDSVGFYRLSTALDPYFYEIYDQAAVNFSCIFDAPFAALEFIDKGIRIYERANPPKRFWSHPYSLYLYRAYVNAFMRNDWAQARIDYLRAAYTPGSPAYLQQMKKWLQDGDGDRKLAIRVLKWMIRTTEDVRIRQKYEEKLRQYER
jgi:hypothetical protein